MSSGATEVKSVGAEEIASVIGRAGASGHCGESRRVRRDGGFANFLAAALAVTGDC